MKKPTSHRATLGQTVPAILLFVSLFWLLPVSIWAQEDPRPVSKPLTSEAVAPLAAKLTEAQKQTLLSTGLVTVNYSVNAQTGLCPNPVAAAAMIAPLNAVKPTIGIETLAVYPMPAALAAKPDRNLILYNIMHRFRSMEGIEYWSASRKVMRVFFTSSKIVKTAADRTAVADPVFTVNEAKHDLLLEQEDSSFGKNLYDVEVTSLDQGTTLLNMNNREKIWYGIIPVLDPNALSLFLCVQPSADGKYLYFYGNAGIRAAKAFGVEEKAKTSYTNRIIALFTWYTREMEAVK